ncbi:MAG: HAD-IIB family hydrolase, partial [Burkholderiales bacterium]|nr:HAD-IIB family hydrolase [Burkholderiales bacterium]
MDSPDDAPAKAAEAVPGPAAPAAGSPAAPAASGPAAPARATGARPRPLADAPAGTWSDVAGVLTDIDDTLTRDGAIEPVALDALHALAAAGVPVIAVTGRPMGWSRPFAAAWPLRAIVAENGAVMLWRDAGGALQVGYAQDEATRAANARRLQAAAARILAELPEARLALDSPGRVTDIAIDHAEHARLDPGQIARVVALMHAQGLHATVSSIHVNGWFGAHDKWSGACWAVRERLARTLPDEVDRWVYVGDSTNDQAMFARFARSVGVANLLDFADRLHTWPAWISAGARGAGFAELAAALLAARA